MPLSTKPYRGARDFYPEDKRLQKYIFSVWRQSVESFGYEEYDAPILEPLDIYLAKTGDEIVNEQTYVFEDRGGRKVVIRPEMTPTVSRMVAAKRQELSYPLRWYSIPNLWRYERPQRGRLREHWQLNVDIFGVASIAAETEIISLVDAIFKAFNATADMYDIRLNHRDLTNFLLSDYLKLSMSSQHKLYRLIDRMHKLERSKFIAAVDEALTAKEREAGATEKLLGLLETQHLKDLPKDCHNSEGYKELTQTLERLKKLGIDNARYDATIMRGFDYYTGIVFEVFDKDKENSRSMMGGGRYDGLVGLFGVAAVPTVGFGWGDVTLINFLQTHHLLPKLKPEADSYVALVGDVIDRAEPVIAKLRGKGLNVAVDLSGKKIGDQFKAADKKGLRFVVIIGEKEIKSGSYKLKDLQTSKEDELNIEGLINKLKVDR